MRTTAPGYWPEKRNFALRINYSEMELPKDPMMLYSMVNMKLRDEYSSLDTLCEDMNVNRAELVKELASVGFEYSPKNNCFR